MTQHAWTPERDAEFRRLWAEGKTGREIAEAMGTTERAIRVRRLHMPDLEPRAVGGARNFGSRTRVVTTHHHTPSQFRPGVCQQWNYEPGTAARPGRLEQCQTPTRNTYCPDCERKRLDGPHGSRFHSVKTIRHTA